MYILPRVAEYVRGGDGAIRLTARDPGFWKYWRISLTFYFVLLLVLDDQGFLQSSDPCGSPIAVQKVFFFLLQCRD